MTKRQHKQLIIVKTVGAFQVAEYGDLFCGRYSRSYKVGEIKEDVYNELKQRNLLLA